ncbi:conjugative transposon protein TraM [Subsaxibacter sp. CAU 1640]|uniref:conjugative transposon protein TraM n=1 Tax=Subsaxibacter sp. CAU 1640 TaxID=2933271 RepID=UPI00200590BC|nr:conjugative transposon protein TraM [Subsaxibacter sp. CAU 1640]MCK7591330.1 conjugative transposon protein TraM [Subsaxibacter sp. CAU 1640]
MKIEKNKIVFGSVLAVVVIFLISYSILVMGNDDSESDNLKQTAIPELEQEQEEYKSKLDAINNLKEVRQTNAPSIYDESMLDSLGYYDPDLLDKKKQHIVDSIYASGRIRYSEEPYQFSYLKDSTKSKKTKEESKVQEIEASISAKEMGVEHQLFFASEPIPNKKYVKTDATIYVEVDGNQVVKVNHRLLLRLIKAAVINDMLIPKNTPLYGFISFQPNRAMIEIQNINHHPTNLKAFDLQDGSEGIYIENNFRAEASKEVIDDIIGDINIPSVPQVGGIKKVFQRNNRNVKVTIVNNYKLILKPEL